MENCPDEWEKIYIQSILSVLESPRIWDFLDYATKSLKRHRVVELDLDKNNNRRKELGILLVKNSLTYRNYVVGLKNT